jgi:hypothetical protein
MASRSTSTTREFSQARTDVKELTQALAEPFDPGEVHFKPGAVSGNRALAMAYVDARAIQDRLDEVLGVEGWQDDYECLADGSVVCRLRLRLGDEWITKVDAGGPSEKPGSGVNIKAAFSDALKRAAVKFGIGRYLYRLPATWADYDPRRRQFTRTPTLPAFALPRRAPAQALASPSSEAAPEVSDRDESHRKPANGAELQQRLYKYDGKLAAEGACQRGDLVKHVVQAGVKAGYAAELSSWSGPAIELAVEETKRFESQVKESHKDVA